MKMNKFLMGLGAIAALSLAACSNDEPSNPNTPDQPSTGDDAYIMVKISEQTGARSRADVPDDQFQDGTVYDESLVNTCDFYFYDAKGKYVMTTSALWNQAGQDLPNVEQFGQAAVVLRQVKQKGYPKYMVTILNKPTGFSAPLTLEGMNTQLVGASANIDGAVKNGKYFTMTTTSYADQMLRDGSAALPYYFVNELTEDDFYKTEAEAKAEGKPVQVYVERLAAKVAVKVNMTAVTDKANTYAIKYSVAGVGNNDNEDKDYVSDYTLYVEFEGWGLNATAKDSYYMKNIEATTDGAWKGNTDEVLGFLWNDPTYKRSYWAYSHTYKNIAQDAYNYNKGKKLTNAFWEADEKGKQNAAYLPENTHPATFLNEPKNYNKVTSVLLRAKVYDPKNEGGDLVKFNGILFTADRFIQYVLSHVEPNVWVKNGNVYTQANDEFTLEGDGLNSVNVVFTPAEGVTYVKSTEDKDAQGNTVYVDFTAQDLKKLNEDLDDMVGEGFRGGESYYEIPIRHLRAQNVEAPRTFNDQNLKEGDYGIVRNHYYLVNINSIAKVGTGIWNPEQDIIPVTPPNDEEYYVGAQINILSWRIVSNNVDL